MIKSCYLQTQPQQAQGADITKHIAIFNKLCPPTRKNIEFYEINLNKLTEKLSSSFEAFKKKQKSDKVFVQVYNHHRFLNDESLLDYNLQNWITLCSIAHTSLPSHKTNFLDFPVKAFVGA